MNFQLGSVGSSWITFSWQQSSMNVSIMRHIILVSGGGLERNVTVDGSQTDVNVTGLQSGTEYALRVIAVAIDGQRSPPSVALLATTSEPGTRFHALEYQLLMSLISGSCSSRCTRGSCDREFWLLLDCSFLAAQFRHFHVYRYSQWRQQSNKCYRGRK